MNPRILIKLSKEGFSYMSRIFKATKGMRRGATATRSLNTGSKAIKTIEVAAVTGPNTGVVKYVPRGLSKVVNTNTSTGKVFSSVFKTANVSKKWKSSKGLLSKAASLAMLGMTAFEIYDLFKGGDSDVLNGEKGDLSIRDLQKLENAANATQPIGDFTYGRQFRVLGNEENSIFETIRSLFLSKSFIINGVIDDVSMDYIHQLDLDDKLRAIELLNSMAKAFSNETDHPEFLEAFRIQTALSFLDDSQRTNATDFIVEQKVHLNESFKAACASYTETITGMNNELSLAAADDYFEDTTFQMFDLFDLLPWGDRESYKGDQELKNQQGAIFLATSLATDMNFALVNSFIDRFSIDSDGEDDESAAIDLLMHNQKMSNRNNIARNRLAAGNDIDASLIYTRS